MPAVNSPITVLHTVPIFVRARTKQLGISRATYLTILLSNYLTAGRVGLPYVVGRDKKRKRVDMQVTLPKEVRAAGAKAAARWDMSFSRFMEALIVWDARTETPDLTILANSPKPVLTGVK